MSDERIVRVCAQYERTLRLARTIFRYMGLSILSYASVTGWLNSSQLIQLHKRRRDTSFLLYNIFLLVLSLYAYLRGYWLL